MSDNIDLFGWDTACAISFAKANEAIKALKSSPASYDESNNHNGITKAAIKGNWGDWELTTDSDGQNLMIKCPIASGTYSTIEEDKTFDLSGQWLIVTIKLNYFDENAKTHSDPTAKPATGEQKNLQVRTQSSDPTDPVASIHASSYTFSDAEDPITAKAICDALFSKHFNEHLDEFKHVFSILIVNATADKDQFQWLKPTSVSYATNSTGDLNTSVFGVLAMTENRPVHLNTHSIDPRLLTIANGHSAFAINSNLFVKKWILPGLMTMRLGSTPNDYVLANDGQFYQNIDKIQWGTFLDNHNNPAAAYVETGKFSVGLVGDLIKVEFIDLYWDIEDGITAHVNYTEFYELSLKSGTDKKGLPYSNVLTANQKGKPSLVVSTSMADWKRKEELGFAIGMSILGAVVGGLAGGALDAATTGVGEAAAAAEQSAVESGVDAVSMDLSDVLSDVISDSESSISEASEQGLSDAASDIGDASESEEAGESSSSILSKGISKVQSFGKNLWASKWKLIGGMLGGGIGAAIGSIPQILDSLAQENFSDVPSLDEFGANCIGAVQWPNSSGFNLTSASLNGALVLGGDLIPVEQK